MSDESDVAGPVRVYVFRASGWKQDATCSAAAGPTVIRAFGSIDAFQKFFGGYMTFGRLFHSNEFLGVWGQRNASRFRRILAERSGEVEIVHAAPPARYSGSSVTGKRMPSAARQAAEQAFGRKASD